MTRLEKDDIDRITRQLDDYDARLKRMTGASLRQIACRAAGVDEALILDLLDQVRIAAVPVSSGLGVIGGFSGAVAAIVSHLGFETFVTESSDVAGIAEGLERGADILMLADDERFIALTPGGSHVVENSRATAKGFVAGLELMKGGVAGESVLVLGCGPVGKEAAKALIDRGAEVALCDTKQERALAALREIGQDASDRIRLEDSPLTALGRYELIFDATDEGSFIEPAHLTPRTVVAAPGMPCALTPEAMVENRDRVLHDALEIGTATMAVQAAVQASAQAAVQPTANLTRIAKAEKASEE
jgi:pyrrolysine biosynthesis protein PylD